MKYIKNNPEQKEISTVMPPNKMPMGHTVSHWSLHFLPQPASLDVKIDQHSEKALPEMMYIQGM